MSSSISEEVKTAAEESAADLYRRHLETGADLNPYSTPGGRAEFDRAYANLPRRSWEEPMGDFDYRYQLGRAVALLVNRGAAA